MSTTEVARAALRIAGRPLPQHVEAWARSALLDTLAVQLAGTRTAVGRAAVAAAARHPGTRPVPGTRLRADAGWAALAGAAAASALDYDDGHYRGGGIHAGSTVLPTLLAAAPGGTPLRRLRGALVAGYEVAQLAGHLVSPAISGLPYRASGYASALGATAALAALRGLSEDEAATALRVAASHAPNAAMTSGGSREAIGWAAMTAVGAVDLARSGYGETTDASLLAPAGPTVFDEHTAHSWTRSLGEEFEVLRGYVKPYPCCRAAHAMLDALRDLRRSAALDPLRIRGVAVGTVSGAAGLTVAAPQSLGQAQFALPYLAALLLVHGEEGPQGLCALGSETGPRPADPAVLALARRVTLTPEPAFDANAASSYPARVRLTAEQWDGTLVTHELTVWHARGSAERPLTDGERLGKARGLLRRVLTEDGAAAVEALLTTDDRTIEAVGDTVLAALAEPPPAS